MDQSSHSMASEMTDATENDLDDSTHSSTVFDLDTSIGSGTTSLSGSRKKKKKSSSKKKKPSSSNNEVVDILNKNLCEERSKLFNVQSTPTKGRGLFAMNEIQEGALLFREEPKAMIAYETVCTNCLHQPDEKTPNLLLDESHPYCFYCSRACLEAFSDQKEFELPIIANLEDIAKKSSADIFLLRMIIRILSWQYCEAQNESLDGSTHSITKDDIFIDNGYSIVSKMRGFLLLESHVELQSPSWNESLKKAIELILPLLPSDSKVKASEVLRIAASVNTNAYGCQDVLANNEVVGIFTFF